MFLGKHGHTDTTEIKILRKHLADIKNARKLLELNFRKGEHAAKISSALKELEPFGESFPTDLKLEVLDKKLLEYHKSGEVSKYMAGVWPWPSSDDDDKEFKPTSPKLLAIECSEKERAKNFREKSLKVLLYNLEAGEDGLPKLGPCITEMLTFMDANQPDIASDGEEENDDDETSGIDAAIDLVSGACKALQLVLRVGKANLSVSDLKGTTWLSKIQASQQLRGAQAAACPLHGIAMELMKPESALTEQVQLWDDYGAIVQKHIPRLAQALGQLRNIKAVDDETGCLSNGLEKSCVGSQTCHG